jgi:cysteine synthase
MIYRSILETVGKTPIVELSKLAPPCIKLYGKIEARNPMGSVKDRLALAVIERAEREGALKPGQTVIEATSGNTGIGLAMVCAAKGYPLVVVMAESFSIERRRLMRFLGAKVVLTPAALKGSGMYLKAVELAQKHGWFLARQFENEANADAHTENTAEEILADFAGKRLDYWVTGAGTGGTLKGVARALRDQRPETKIIVVEPDNAQLIGGGVPQPPSTGLAPASHPLFQPHPIQGTGPDFIPKLTADAMTMGLIDQVIPVNGGEAMRLSQELARREGVFAGISSGGAIAGALKIAETAEPGTTILCMLPDTGERYLSTPLFDKISTDMTDEELDIMRSTPSAQFGGPSPAPTPAPAPTPQAVPVAANAKDETAEAYLERAIAGGPVVLFALEWCEFCWSLRKFLEGQGIAYKVVELDAVAMQPEQLGLRVRRALGAKTGSITIPQLFIGGQFVGGCMDAFDAYLDGSLQTQLKAAGVTPKPTPGLDPRDLLPKWLHPRLETVTAA